MQEPSLKSRERRGKNGGREPVCLSVCFSGDVEGLFGFDLTHPTHRKTTYQHTGFNVRRIEPGRGDLGLAAPRPTLALRPQDGRYPSPRPTGAPLLGAPGPAALWWTASEPLLRISAREEARGA